MKKTLLFVVMAILTVYFGASSSFALSPAVRDNLIAKWHGLGPDGTGTISAGDEAAGIAKAWQDYYIEHPITITPHGGGWLSFLALAGGSSVAPLDTVAVATPGDLQFSFYDLGTQQPMLPGLDPAIGSVEYEVCTNYTTLAFSPLGISTDAATDFALPFTAGTGDYMIEAVPFDTSGAPIVFTDPVDGTSNDAIGGMDFVPLPENSSTLGLLGLVTATLAACDWRRRTAKA